jgi:hypothetical protein
MSIKRTLLILTSLVFTNSAFAQPQGDRRAHPGGAVNHPGQQHPSPGAGQRPMTPQQRENFLYQQMWSEQLMFEEMMRSRGRAYRSQSGASQSGGGQNQKTSSGSNRPLTDANRRQDGANGTQSKSNQGQPSAKALQEKRAVSPGNVSTQTKQQRGREGKEKEAGANPIRKEEENSIRRKEVKTGAVNTRSLQGSNQAAINLLKNAHAKMSRADHDYSGHRVRSMEHVTIALQHLGATSAVAGNGYSSQGNLPQAQSDQLLREAEFHLRNVLNTIGTGRNTLSSHHDARASVDAAIRELHVALRIN